jgi:hypothetical protein
VNWTINGLPMHPLFVHAAVMLVPTATIMAILGSVWTAARRKFGIFTPIVSTAAAIAVALTIQAGEALSEKVRETTLVEAHTEGGEAAVPWIVLLVAATWLQWAWFTHGKKRYADGAKPVVKATAAKILPGVLAVLVVVGAVGSAVSVAVIGEAGAKAVWSTTAP